MAVVQSEDALDAMALGEVYKRRIRELGAGVLVSGQEPRNPLKRVLVEVQQPEEACLETLEESLRGAGVPAEQP